MQELQFQYEVSGEDYSRAGEASADVKSRLKQLGIDAGLIRRAVVALYEGEMNLVIHGGGGQITVTLTPQKIFMRLADHGKGIPDIALAMQEGYSTAGEQARSLGFGAGMGLPNMKKYTDAMQIVSQPGCGTTVELTVLLVPQTPERSGCV